MKKISKYFSHLVPSMLGIILMLISSTFVCAESLDSLQLLKISPQDERAIVKMEDGSLCVNIAETPSL